MPWVALGGQVDDNNAKYFPSLDKAASDIVSVVVSTGVRQRDEAIHSTYLAAVRNANERIWVTQAYFSPPHELRQALIDAACHGVGVRVLVPGFTDSGPGFYAARAGYARLLEGGARIFEVTDALLHAKTAVIDNSLTVIGSANFDYCSFLHNNEITAVVISERLAISMDEMFKNDVRTARELNAEQWRHRSAGAKPKESLSRLFNYWL